ncbi:MAG: low affinity iron permease family protein [Chloroflexi bacterium]|nr:low affinity iron permease family protein [Chloroflexota bacterium]
MVGQQTHRDSSRGPPPEHGGAAPNRSTPAPEHFRRFAAVSSRALGTPWAFAIALASVLAWALLGPIFRFSTAWQLVINTSTTIVTFLMVFIIQNTQNRDTLAMNLKLDELLRGTKGPRTSMVDLEDLSDAELRRLRDQFQALSEKARNVFERVEDVEDAEDAEDAVDGETHGHPSKPRAPRARSG